MTIDAANPSPASIPDVALITSWYVPTHPVGFQLPLPGWQKAYSLGHRLFELYFLLHEELDWYWHASGDERHVRRPAHLDSPTGFAGSLTWPQIGNIARALRAAPNRGRPCHHHDPRRCGARPSANRSCPFARPQFRSIATYFPGVCMDGRAGSEAVRALRAALALASLLHCHCVELVGGHAQNDDEAAASRSSSSGTMDMLARNIGEVYNLADTGNVLGHANVGLENLPMLSVELEPSPSAVLNRLEQFRSLLRSLPSPVRRKVGLNIDVAHALLIGYSPADLEGAADNGPDLTGKVAHMHISDHSGVRHEGGAHASDLAFGSFHHFVHFAPWLRLAIRLCRANGTHRTGVFSHCVSVEMEAANDLHSVLASVCTVRDWLETVACEQDLGAG